MDPLSLSVAMLLAKAVGGAAEETGRAAAGALGRLLATVRGRLAGDELAQAVLAAVERSPADAASTRALAVAIGEHAGADAAFRDELVRLVAEAERDPRTERFVTEVRDHARVGKLVNIGHARAVSF
ncbi:MAG: hypothetical protein ACRDLF_09675 [Solirubrobacteraceae bacterium]